MSRPLRLEFGGALYHVTSRGDRREASYKDDEDRERFLDILGRVVRDFNWICHAYCLTGNHYHQLIETPDGNLSKGMRQLNGVFTQASNRRHRRGGHLFQGRYMAILVDADAYLLELARYIALNPVRVGMVADPGAWLWSSYRAMLGQSSRPPWLADFVGRKDRDAAMAAAHATGEYSYQQIAEAFGVRFTTVGRVAPAQAERTTGS